MPSNTKVVTFSTCTQYTVIDTIIHLYQDGIHFPVAKSNDFTTTCPLFPPSNQLASTLTIDTKQIALLPLPTYYIVVIAYTDGEYGIYATCNNDPLLIHGLPLTSFSYSDKSEYCSNHPVMSNPSGWCSLDNRNNSYLQVDLGSIYNIGAVGTKGRGDLPEWVTTYTLQYCHPFTNPMGCNTSNNESFITYDTTLQGNIDQNSLQIQQLSPHIFAQYLRFIPKTYSGGKSMRIEAYDKSIGLSTEIFCNSETTLAINSSSNYFQTFTFNKRKMNYTKVIFSSCDSSQPLTITIYNESWNRITIEYFRSFHTQCKVHPLAVYTDYHLNDSSDIYYVSVSSNSPTSSVLCVSCINNQSKGSTCDLVHQRTNTCEIVVEFETCSERPIEIRCDNDYPNCSVYLNGFEVMLSEDIRIPIHCPSNLCFNCNIYGKHVIQNVDINGYDCESLMIESEKPNSVYGFSYTTLIDNVNIYAPDNGGTLIIPTFLAARTHVYISGTHNVIIHGHISQGFYYNEDIFISVYSVTGYFNYTISGKLRTENTNILCGDFSQCNINCSSSSIHGGCTNMNVQIDNTSSVQWYCDPKFEAECYGSILSCGNLKESPLVWTYRYGWYYQTGNCVQDWPGLPPISCTFTRGTACFITHQSSDRTRNVTCHPKFIDCEIHISGVFEHINSYNVSCPSNVCDRCTISCSDKHSCSNITIFGHNCSTLSIDIISSQQTYMNIYAPGSGGSLIITVGGLYALNQFYTSKIYSVPGTYDMTLDFSKCTTCNWNYIDGTFVTHEMNVICAEGASCSGSIISCPNDAVCNINCTSTLIGACRDMKVYAPEGTHDVSWICDTECDAAKLICNNGASQWEYNYTTNEYFYWPLDCVDPPTHAPTTSPTVPTISPTLKTLSPTFPPTNAPTFAPTSAPITYEWFEKIELNKVKGYVMVVGSVVGFLMFLVGFLWCVYYYRYKKPRLLREEKTVYIGNGLVLSICIGQYNKPKRSPIKYHLQNLDAIDKDIENIRGLFRDNLNYDVFDTYDEKLDLQIEWTEQEMKNFLEEKSNFLTKNIDDGKCYDGLIVFVSSHGMASDFVCTSDYGKYSKQAIHRQLSHPKSRNIPRLFIFDCCSGAGSRTQEIYKSKSVGNEIPKQVDMENIPSENQKWFQDGNNPDYFTAIVNASNPGFQSKMNMKSGSYLINDFCQLTLQDLENDTGKFIHETFEEIQTDLHSRGKQMPAFIWNGTGYIRFKSKTTNNNQEAEMEMTKLKHGYSSVVTDPIEEKDNSDIDSESEQKNAV